jgi:hypothetical protein
MKRLYEKKSKYSMIIEDDAIATVNWYEKTIDAIKYLVSLTDDWLCLKLFTSFQSFDWVLNIDALVKSCFYIVLFTVAQCLILNYLLQVKSNHMLPLANYNKSERIFFRFWKEIPKKNIFFLIL